MAVGTMDPGIEILDLDIIDKAESTLMLGGFADKKKEEWKEGQDYTTPAGWAVTVCPLAVHLNPFNYKDPLEFNPSRWEQMEQKGASKNFMAFGGGMRFFVGIDFTYVHMAVFLHFCVTKGFCISVS